MKIFKPLKRIFSKGRTGQKDKEVLTGRVARSVSGRDEGSLYVITGHADGIFVYVADGARKRVAAPKRKNVRHLLLTGITLPQTFLQKGKVVISDEELCAFLSGIDEKQT